MAPYSGEFHVHIEMCVNNKMPGFCELVDFMWKYGKDKKTVTTYVNKICQKYGDTPGICEMMQVMCHNSHVFNPGYGSLDNGCGCDLPGSLCDLPGICHLMEVMWLNGLGCSEILSYFMDANIDFYLEACKPLICKPWCEW